MKNLLKTLLLGVMTSLLLMSGILPCFAGLTYQDFEPDNGSTTYCWALDPLRYYVRLSMPGEPAFDERSALLLSPFPHYWGKIGVESQVHNWNINFDLAVNDRFTFWIHSTPLWGGRHTVGVTFYDNGLYADNGFEVWTTKTTFTNEWTQLTVLFSQLPPDLDLKHIHHIVFSTYWPTYNPGEGYFFDNLTVVRADRMYQAFEPEQRSGSTIEEYAWAWNPNDTVDFSQGLEPAAEGLHSLKFISTEKWGGFGLQSEMEKLVDGNQTFWHVDLHPQKNDRLVFYAYNLAENNLDNNLALQFYDHENHHTDETKVVVWAKKAAHHNKWTRLEVPFSDLPETLNLNDLNKIQIQEYWPGTYYFDDIRATSPILSINEKKLLNGIVKWNSYTTPYGLEKHETLNTELSWRNIKYRYRKYELQESRVSADGPWETVYSGYETSFNVTRLTKLWYQVRWKEITTLSRPIPYVSDWSDVVQYTPTLEINNEQLNSAGLIEWNAVPLLADLYELESAHDKEGPWATIYSGAYPTNPIPAIQGKWYRVRALHLEQEIVTDVTKWSTPQHYAPGQEFLKSAGTIIRDQDGNGDEVLLQGINLGGLLLIEKWMTGIGAEDSPNIEDDFTIREVLTERFGEDGCDQLLTAFQEAYIDSIDFINLKDMGINFVRLPIFFRILQDDEGNWITNDLGEIDFSRIDRIVNFCADRGIYVMLDLHGAPGGQSPEAHTGQENLNKLFEDSPEGQTYRDRTVEIWETIATHYQDNAAVCGYDLLNEPTGAPTNQDLWDLYGRLYDAIRAIDNNHIIVMEGVWDWTTLPNPAGLGWSNVMYQFHYYLWDYDEDIAAHMNYIDSNIAQADVYQDLYNVPVLIGEFHGFSQKAIWEYYLQNFNEQHWSWSLWTQKFHSSPSNWGLYNHADYNKELPKLRDGGDSLVTLLKKFQRYATNDFHCQNFSLIKLIKQYFLPPTIEPYIAEISPETTQIYQTVHISGINFGQTQGDSAVLFENDRILPVITWSDTFIRVQVPSDETRYYGMIKIQTNTASSNEVLLHIIQ